MPGVKDWLRKASSDLKASKKLSDDYETFDCSVFHTHQCAEKAFKAYIISTERAIPRTHDLSFLLADCMESDSGFLLLREESKSLNIYVSDARYPNDYFHIDKQKTDEAIEMAERIFYAVKNKLSL